MKTQTPHKTATAALSATAPQNLAALSMFELQTGNGTDVEPGWQQILPAGTFNARDGRPFDVAAGSWLMDEIAFQSIREQLVALNQPVLIDYDHQTLYKNTTGQKAPAAGWVPSADAIKFDPRFGLMIKPDWTESAREAIKRNEFRFPSAVINYDTDTGRVLELRMVAITNDPAVTGMKALTALSAEQNTPTNNEPEITPVSEEMKKLLGLLGITVETGKELTAEQGAAALSAVEALQTSAAKTTELETQVTALSAQTGAGGIPDPAKYVPVAVVDGLTKQLAALSAESTTGSVDSIIEKGRAEGRVFEAEVDWLKNYGKTSGAAALSAYVEKRPAIPGLTPQQQSTTVPEKEKGAAALSAEDRAVMRVTGISEADFIAARKKQLEAQ